MCLIPAYRAHLLITVFCFLAAPSVAVAASPLDEVKPFLNKYCLECHGAELQENNKRFDNLETSLAKLETLQLWQGIVDQLNLGDMPPKDSPQPTNNDVAKVIRVISPRLQEADAELRSTGGQTVTRRLNRFELRNTIRDL